MYLSNYIVIQQSLQQVTIVFNVFLIIRSDSISISVNASTGYGPRVYVMANAIVTNSFKDVSHLLKFNGQNRVEI